MAQTVVPASIEGGRADGAPSPIEPIYSTVGEWMRRERKRLGITQQDLATLTGLSRPAIVNMELGRQRIMLHTIMAMLDHFEATPAHTKAIADGFHALSQLRRLA